MPAKTEVSLLAFDSPIGFWVKKGASIFARSCYRIFAGHRNIGDFGPRQRLQERMNGPDGGIVCIVDDDEAVRDSLRLLLESSGLATRCFASADAFIKAGAPKMACLILDLHMPGTSGLELLRLLRRGGICLPVFVVSGRRDPLLDAEVHAAGATNLLSKPFDDKVLLDLVLGAVVA
jgi:CheY-like chemotaxis protein